jgi:ElaB/YqjD/DUF883 family membrane-anchored ribosome-binding protein
MSTTASSIHTLPEQRPTTLDDAASNMARSASDAMDAAARSSARWTEKALELADRYTDMAKHTVDSVRDQTQAINERTQQYVRDEPVKSVLIAAVAGAVLGSLVVLLRRR